MQSNQTDVNANVLAHPTSVSGDTARGPLERSFAAQLRHAMATQRFSPGELGKRTGITPGAVRSYLRGTFLPRPPVRTQLENLLQVRFNLTDPSVTVATPMTPVTASSAAETTAAPTRLTISEAKAILATSLGVDPSCIEIIVRS